MKSHFSRAVMECVRRIDNPNSHEQLIIATNTVTDGCFLSEIGYLERTWNTPVDIHNPSQVAALAAFHSIHLLAIVAYLSVRCVGEYNKVKPLADLRAGKAVPMYDRMMRVESGLLVAPDVLKITPSGLKRFLETPDLQVHADFISEANKDAILANPLTIKPAAPRFSLKNSPSWVAFHLRNAINERTPLLVQSCFYLFFAAASGSEVFLKEPTLATMRPLGIAMLALWTNILIYFQKENKAQKPSINFGDDAKKFLKELLTSPFLPWAGLLVFTGGLKGSHFWMQTANLCFVGAILHAAALSVPNMSKAVGDVGNNIKTFFENASKSVFKRNKTLITDTINENLARFMKSTGSAFSNKSFAYLFLAAGCFATSHGAYDKVGAEAMIWSGLSCMSLYAVKKYGGIAELAGGIYQAVVPRKPKPWSDLTEPRRVNL